MQFCDDNNNERKFSSPNEPEFRAYYILAHIRSSAASTPLSLHVPLPPLPSTQRNTHFKKATLTVPGNPVAPKRVSTHSRCFFYEG